MRSATLLLCAAAVALLSAPAAHATIIIDSFDLDQSVIADESTRFDNNIVGADASFLGTERQLAVFTFGFSGSFTMKGQINTGESGTLDLGVSVDPGDPGAVGFFLRWGEVDSVADIGDLTDGGTLDRLALGITFSNIAEQARFTITDTDGNVGQATMNLADGIAAPTIETLPFSEFSGVDFTSIDEVKMSVSLSETPQNWNLQFDYLAATNVPASGALALLCVAGLSTPRRRRRDASGHERPGRLSRV